MNVLPTRSPRHLLLFMIALLPSAARADITGLNDYTLNREDLGAPSVLVDANTIQLTTGAAQKRSLWFNVPQDVSEFTASFTYRVNGILASASRQGLAFVMQNDLGGVNVIGATAPGGVTSFGYLGIEPSAAVTIELDTGPARTFTSLYTEGVIGGGATSVFPINAFGGTEIDVAITYDGSILSVGMSDGVNVFPARNYLIGPLSDVVGGSTAYVGFTAGTTLGANQFISDFQFQSVPEPASLVLAAIGCGLLALRFRMFRTRRWL